MSGGNQSYLHGCLIKAIRDYIKARGGWPLKYFAGGLGALAGAPDFFCAVPIPGTDLAAFVAIEAKTGDAVLNTSQQRVRREMEACQVLYIVAHSADDVEAALLDAGLIEAPALMNFRGG